jgi:hypothetical protein
MNYDDLDQLWDRSRREIFRLETLPVYDVPEEAASVAAFLRGEPLPVHTPDNHPWYRKLADTVARGVRIYRVHVIDWPLTGYLRFELAGYPELVSAGTQVYITERGSHPELAGLNEDFWLFDEQHVAVMRYDPQGHPLGPEPGDDVAKYVAGRDAAMAHAVSLDAWLRENGDRLSA